MKHSEIKRTVLGANIILLRKKRGWRQNRLAKEAGTQALGCIESGARKAPYYATLLAISRALGVTVADLYAEPAPTKPKLYKGRSEATRSANEHMAGAMGVTVPELLESKAKKRRGARS